MEQAADAARPRVLADARALRPGAIKGHVDAGSVELGRQAARERGEGGVPGVVRDGQRVMRRWAVRAHRIDDVAGTPILHMRQQRRGRAHRAEQVRLEHPLPVAWLDPVERALASAMPSSRISSTVRSMRSESKSAMTT